MSGTAQGYDALYREFDTPLMRQIRREAYGEDIGQHSWVGADEMRADIARLRLGPSSHLVDLGCGPCGPLTFAIATTRCRGTGLELSAAALDTGQARAKSLGVAELLATRVADLNAPLPFADATFDAAMSLDVVLHLRDRGQLFAEVARVLRPGGRFLCIDAGVVTGALSNDELRLRSGHGYSQFVPPGWNDRLLTEAGFRILDVENRTPSVVRNANGRLTAMAAHRAELERVSGAAALDEQRRYLEAVVELSRREALSRVVYLAEVM